MKNAVKSLISFLIMPLTAAVLITLTAGCDLVNNNPEQTNSGFWARRMDNYQWYQVPATQAYVGTSCIIYVEDASSNLVSSNTARSVAIEFDNNIYSLTRANFGAEYDVDGNGKVIILILDIKDGYSGSGGYVAGYFDATHEMQKSTLYPNSNEKDMLFMDCDPGFDDATNFFSTMAHEFQHMINFNQKYIQQGVGVQDTWINEGLSSAAETLYTGTIITWKTNYYNEDPDLNIRYGQNFVCWGSGVGSAYTDNLGNYSTVYLFFQWLRLQSSITNGIFKSIISNTYCDYRCVEANMKTTMYSGAGVWKDYLRDWFTANIYCQNTGLYGYKGQIKTTPHLINPGSSWQLYPGEGVYSGITTSYTITPAGYIDYAGLNTNTRVSDTNGSSYTGNVLVTFHHNGSKDGSVETTGTLPSVVVKSGIEGGAIESFSRKAPKGSYPIDAAFNLNDKTVDKTAGIRRVKSLDGVQFNGKKR